MLSQTNHPVSWAPDLSRHLSTIRNASLGTHSQTLNPAVMGWKQGCVLRDDHSPLKPWVWWWKTNNGMLQRPETGSTRTWPEEQRAFRVISLNRLGEGGHTAVSHSGPKGPREWKSEYSADCQAPAIRTRRAHPPLLRRAGQEEMRGGGGHVPSKCPDALGTGNYRYLTLPWLICTWRFAENSALWEQELGGDPSDGVLLRESSEHQGH